MLSNLWSDYKAFYAQPFKSDMSVTGYFLFVGLIIVLFVLWTLILNEIVGTIRRAA